MKSRGYLAIIVGVLLIAICAQAQDTGNTDTLRYNCYNVFRAGLDSFGIPIYVHTDEPLYALFVVYCYESSQLTFSSATLGERLAGVSSSALIVVELPGEKAFILSWVGTPEHPIVTAGDTWLFATAYFRNDFHLPCPDDLWLENCIVAPGVATTFTPVAGDEFSPHIRQDTWPGLCPVLLCMAADEEGLSPNNPATQLGVELHPNPFNSGTVLEITTSAAGPLHINIFDILGRRVRTLVEDQFAAGTHEFAWDGRDDSGRPAASGVYFARTLTPSRLTTTKLVLLR
jgi:hypothetical protein